MPKKSNPAVTLPRMNAPAPDIDQLGQHGDKRPFSPHREWRRLFLGFVAFNLLMICFHVFFYYMMTTGGLFTPTEDVEQPEVTIDTEELETTLNYFEGRGKELRARLAEPELIPEIR